MASPRVATLLAPILLLFAGCVTSEAVCDPLARPAEAVATFIGTIDAADLHFAVQEAGWTDIKEDPAQGLRARWALDSGTVLHLAVVEERSAFGARTVVHAWGGVGLADAAAAERLLEPFLEPTLLYLEPHVGRPATLEYAGGACE